MSRIFFTADQHFGHANIIKLCSRPFSCLVEMDEVLIDAWNSVVGDTDVVYVVGDFAYKSAADPASYFKRLRGSKHLLVGNHDCSKTKHLPWVSVGETVIREFHGTRLHVHHYPLREWQGYYQRAVHLHGHTHGSIPNMPGSIDVGVDSHGFKPWSIEEILDATRQWREST